MPPSPLGRKACKGTMEGNISPLSRHKALSSIGKMKAPRTSMQGAIIIINMLSTISILLMILAHSNGGIHRICSIVFFTSERKMCSCFFVNEASGSCRSAFVISISRSLGITYKPDCISELIKLPSPICLSL